jgi:hypothetical protein
MPWASFADQLRSELTAIGELTDELVDASSLEYRGHFNRGSGVTFVAPDWRWASPTDHVRQLRMRILPRLDRWIERFKLLFTQAPRDLRAEGSEATRRLRGWIARDGHGWEVPATIDEARAKIAADFDKARNLLDIVAPGGSDVTVVGLPDTSALLDEPDLAKYRAFLGVDAAELILSATALSELDSLKDQGRTPEVREKARAAIRVIKSVRQQGSLLEGVTIADRLIVFSRPQEPNAQAAIGNLDLTVPDDRLLATAFEIQAERPAAAVVLITADANLQTKAELARLPFVDPRD